MALPSIPLLLLSCVCLLYAELHMMAVLYTLVGFTASANSILLILLVLRMNVRIARLSGMGMLMMPTLRSSLVPAFGMAGHIAVAKKWEMALEMRDKLQNPATVRGYLRDLDILMKWKTGKYNFWGKSYGSSSLLFFYRCSPNPLPEILIDGSRCRQVSLMVLPTRF